MPKPQQKTKYLSVQLGVKKSKDSIAADESPTFDDYQEE